MTRRIKQRVSIDLVQGPSEFQLRLSSGEVVTFKRNSPEEIQDLELTAEECAQLEGEGYSIKPGLSAYRPKAKTKKPKKLGDRVKDIAAPRKTEDDR